MPDSATSNALPPSEAPRRRDLLQIGMGAVSVCYAAALGSLLRLSSAKKWCVVSVWLKPIVFAPCPAIILWSSADIVCDAWAAARPVDRADTATINTPITAFDFIMDVLSASRDFRLSGSQKCNQVGLFPCCKSDTEANVMEVHDIRQRHSRTVVEVRCTGG